MSKWVVLIVAVVAVVVAGYVTGSWDDYCIRNAYDVVECSR